MMQNSGGYSPHLPSCARWSPHSPAAVSTSPPQHYCTTPTLQACQPCHLHSTLTNASHLIHTCPHLATTTLTPHHLVPPSCKCTDFATTSTPLNLDHATSTQLHCWWTCCHTATPTPASTLPQLPPPQPLT